VDDSYVGAEGPVEGTREARTAAALAQVNDVTYRVQYGVATMSRLRKIIHLFCKRAL